MLPWTIIVVQHHGFLRTRQARLHQPDQRHHNHRNLCKLVRVLGLGTGRLQRLDDEQVGSGVKPHFPISGFGQKYPYLRIFVIKLLAFVFLNFLLESLFANKGDFKAMIGPWFDFDPQL